MSAHPAPPLAMTIAAVERDTRIGKDTLRVWERRYGFPQPVRDANGERLYPPEQVERLRHVKRMLDAGFRPGRVVALSLDELLRLTGPESAPPLARNAAGPALDETPGAARADVEALLGLLRRHELGELRRSLGQALLRLGLERFVLDLTLPLVQALGQAWSRGALEVFEEHLCSEMLETHLRAAIAGAPEPNPAARPRVLLSTVPFEGHGLGLLMAEAMFRVHGCQTLSLGRQTPLRDIGRAAAAQQADIVALSFSAAASANPVLDSLTELRAQLPDSIELWAGSPLPALQRRCPDAVRLVDRLDAIGPAVERWRTLAT